MTAALADQRAALDESRWFLRWYGTTGLGLLVLALTWGDIYAAVVLSAGSFVVTWVMGRHGGGAHVRFSEAAARFDAATAAIAGCPTHGPTMRLALGAQAGA